MTPAQAHALLGDDDTPRGPRREPRKSDDRAGWTKIRNQEDLAAVLAGLPRPE